MLTVILSGDDMEDQAFKTEIEKVVYQHYAVHRGVHGDALDPVMTFSTLGMHAHDNPAPDTHRDLAEHLLTHGMEGNHFVFAINELNDGFDVRDEPLSLVDPDDREITLTYDIHKQNLLPWWDEEFYAVEHFLRNTIRPVYPMDNIMEMTWEFDDPMVNQVAARTFIASKGLIYSTELEDQVYERCGKPTY